MQAIDSAVMEIQETRRMLKVAMGRTREAETAHSEAVYRYTRLLKDNLVGQTIAFSGPINTMAQTGGERHHMKVSRVYREQTATVKNIEFYNSADTGEQIARTFVNLQDGEDDSREVTFDLHAVQWTVPEVE